MIPIVVPSHDRAGRVTAFGAITNIVLCVAEGQEADYREAYPNTELLVHPDAVKGISPKRQWIYEQVGDVFMTDDDVTDLRRLHDPDAKTSRCEPDEAWEIVQITASVADELGAKLWGLANNAIGRNFAAAHPFRTSGYVNAMSMGLFKDRYLHFPEDPYCVAEDYYISALNAHYHRFIWADDRFGFHQTDTFHNLGGLSEYRHSGHEERWMLELKRLFGENIIVEKHMAKKHRYEKILHIPWSKGVQ